MAEQSTAAVSLLSHYRTMIHLRNEHDALRVGDYFPVESNHPKVMALVRVSLEETLLVIINLDEEQVDEYSLSLQDGLLSGMYQAEPLLEAGDLIVDGILPSPSTSVNGGFDLYRPISELQGTGTYIIRLLPKQ